MHRAVPPPDETASEANEPQATATTAPPLNITKQHWEKFQALKARRRELCQPGQVKRALQAKKKLLYTVGKQLSSSDKDLLKEDGVKIPRSAERAFRKRPRHKTLDKDMASLSSPLDRGDSAASHSGETEETKWQELKNYLDPNPQLKGWDKGRLLPKSKLEKMLDKMVERGDLDQAAGISDKIASREMACKVATAFDCVDYAKRRRAEEERRKRKKPAKLKWMFEQKHLWESKGNM